LATLDRIVFPNHDALVALAAAGAVTSRIGLMTDILIEPLRNPVLLAKEAASVDQISSGRLLLGMAAGSRTDDFDAVGQDYKTRGRRFDSDIEVMKRAWAGEPVAGGVQPVGPKPVREGGIPMIFGGFADASIQRMVKWGIGWTAGGASADQIAPAAQRVRESWHAAGREGEPVIVALAYFALGAGAGTDGPAYLRDYYGGAPWVEGLVSRLPSGEEAVKTIVTGVEGAGVSELIFFPTIADVAQVDLLADAVSPEGRG
jgi:alkanesulfonate monooxygenase SsuD/methylene tetrahydromethanopterin reductase-like flavin-dependent oxidoreductase (luciferase family)